MSLPPYAGPMRKVRHARATELAGFTAIRNECHVNVQHWCQEHPGHKCVRGWLVTGGAIFDKHSVVDLGAGGLLDITPMSDRAFSEFLPHDGSEREFDTLPNQIIAAGS